MTTQILFIALVALVIAERLFELRLANRNTARARAQGAVEAGAEHYRWMVRLHGLFLVSACAEVLLLKRPFVPPLAGGMLVLLVLAALLRFWVIRTLGERWTTRIICWPGRPVTRRGPYRYLRHPNYLAVVVEIVALPMVHSAWLTALVFSALNLVLLAVRIRAEEAALAEHSSYDERFSSG